MAINTRFTPGAHHDVSVAPVFEREPEDYSVEGLCSGDVIGGDLEVLHSSHMAENARDGARVNPDKRHSLSRSPLGRNQLVSGLTFSRESASPGCDGVGWCGVVSVRYEV